MSPRVPDDDDRRYGEPWGTNPQFPDDHDRGYSQPRDTNPQFADDHARWDSQPGGTSPQFADEDRRYRYSRLTNPAARPLLKWVGLFVAWVLVTWLLSAIHLSWLVWPLMVALIWYVVVDILRTTPPARRRPAPERPAARPSLPRHWDGRR